MKRKKFVCSKSSLQESKCHSSLFNANIISITYLYICITTRMNSWHHKKINQNVLLGQVIGNSLKKGDKVNRQQRSCV